MVQARMFKPLFNLEKYRYFFNLIFNFIYTNYESKSPKLTFAQRAPSIIFFCTGACSNLWLLFFKRYGRAIINERTLNKTLFACFNRSLPGGVLVELPAARRYASFVFGISISTVKIECKFSDFKSTKSRIRSSMTNETAMAALQASDLAPVSKTTMVCPRYHSP